MSEIYKKYCALKQEDKETMYLFKNGNFYIFIGEDADRINEYVVLKQTHFCKEAKKCGFPLNYLNDYLRVFDNHGLKIKVIENAILNDEKNVIDKIKNLDLDNTTPNKALNLLYEFKEML